MARPERFELPTFWFVARRSIQLSYERAVFVTLMLTSACLAVKQHEAVPDEHSLLYPKYARLVESRPGSR